ncbi:MAG: hypothetical protein CMJ75_15755 [Planctomycetaceae bacterium]|nr:hypothetical protein [Planctomycetaceae bacterium]
MKTAVSPTNRTTECLCVLGRRSGSLALGTGAAHVVPRFVRTRPVAIRKDQSPCFYFSCWPQNSNQIARQRGDNSSRKARTPVAESASTLVQQQSEATASGAGGTSINAGEPAAGKGNPAPTNSSYISHIFYFDIQFMSPTMEGVDRLHIGSPKTS